MRTRIYSDRRLSIDRQIQCHQDCTVSPCCRQLYSSCALCLVDASQTQVGRQTHAWWCNTTNYRAACPLSSPSIYASILRGAVQARSVPRARDVVCCCRRHEHLNPKAKYCIFCFCASARRGSFALRYLHWPRPYTRCLALDDP